MKKCAFIYNPNTKNGKINNYKSEIINILSEDYSVFSESTNKKYHAIEIIKELEENFDLVLSCGGDGTFNEIVKGNIFRMIEGKNQFLLSHLPFGTANDLGNNFYKTKNILKVVSDILKGKEINIDVFKINNDYFFYVAALGIFSKSSYGIPSKIKQKLGYLSYLISAISEIFDFKPIELSYETDNKKDFGKYSVVLASNTFSVGGIKFNILKNSNLCDEKFEFRILKYKNNLQTIFDLIRMMFGNENISNLYSISTSKVNIHLIKTFNKNWSIDGEKNIEHYSDIEIKKAGTTRLLVPDYTHKRLSI